MALWLLALQGGRVGPRGRNCQRSGRSSPRWTSRPFLRETYVCHGESAAVDSLSYRDGEGHTTDRTYKESDHAAGSQVLDR